MHIIAHKNGKQCLNLVKCMIGWFPFRIINSFGTKIQINTESAFEDEITGFDNFNKFDEAELHQIFKIHKPFV